MSATERTVADVREDVVLGAGLLSAAANIIMQLSRPEVGYGVVESVVDDGNVYKRPVKRGRTTLTYLAVALLGTDEERAAYRRAVNRQHARVYSTESSPVHYNAFDPELQLWVAACLYKGFEDVYRTFLGSISAGDQENVYQAASTLGTTLQVQPDMWPVNRQEFQRYWERSLERVSIDDTMREYLYGIAVLRFLPRPLSVVLGPFNRFVTTGFLPPRFRERMGLHWTTAQQRRFDRLTAIIGRCLRVSPQSLRTFPYNVCLWDLRRRIRRGQPLV